MSDRRWKRVLLLIPLALALSCAATSPDDAALRILLFTRTQAFRHESIAPAVSALRAKASAAGVAVDATEDASLFNGPDLTRYDAVVFLMTTGDVLDTSQQNALMDFVRRGGGFAGVHSATDTEYDWPWYGQLVGAYFDGHPSNPGVRQGRLLVRASDHPATRGLPPTWQRSDEWYQFRSQQPGLTVLLDIDETSYKSVAENPAPSPRPIAWFRPFDGGLSFYTALGHTDESWSEPLFLSHVWGGIVAVLGEKGRALTGP
jgi:type 1 glutamine amidotransferase